MAEIILTETVDVKICEWIIRNQKRFTLNENNNGSEFLQIKSMEQVIEYLEYCKNHNGKYSVEYKTANKGKKNHGRLYGSKNCFQSIPRIIRHTLCSNYYYDIDMVNSAPTILLNLCQKYNLRCKFLLKYVNDRNTIMDEIIGHNKSITKADIKFCILKIMNGGNIIQKLNGIELIDDLYHEFNTIVEKLMSIYKDFNRKVQNNDRANENPNGTFIASLLQNEENKILMATYDFFKENGITISSLIFDGLMIPKKSISHDDLNNMLDNLNKYIKDLLDYDITFIIKPMTEGISVPIEEIDKLEVQQAYHVNDDVEAADIILDYLGNTVIRFNDNVTYRYFIKISQSLYKECNKQKDLDNYIINKIFDLSISLPSKKEIVHSKSFRDAERFCKTVVAKLNDTENFIEDMFTKHINKICFTNGYLQSIMIEKDKYDYIFKQYDDSIKVVNYITYPFNPVRNEKVIEEIYTKILKPIFHKKEQRDYFLNWAARRLFGHAREKTWGSMIGSRNSGKGVLIEIFTAAFGKYIGNFNGNDLLTNKTSNSDSAKSCMWIKSLEFCRLSFSNEIKMINDDGKRTTIDGIVIKQISSGGDKLQVRGNHQDPISIKLHGTICLMSNSFPKVDPSDAITTLEQFQCNSCFVDELTEEHIKINETSDDMKYFIKDDTIKDFCNLDIVKENFIHIILDHYKLVYVKKPEIMAEIKSDLLDNESKEEKYVKSLFELTLLQTDTLPISEVHDMLKDKYHEINKSSISIYLLSKGISKKKNSKDNGKYHYYGIKIIPQKK